MFISANFTDSQNRKNNGLEMETEYPHAEHKAFLVLAHLRSPFFSANRRIFDDLSTGTWAIGCNLLGACDKSSEKANVHQCVTRIDSTFQLCEFITDESLIVRHPQVWKTFVFATVTRRNSDVAISAAGARQDRACALLWFWISPWHLNRQASVMSCTPYGCGRDGPDRVLSPAFSESHLD